MALHTPTVEKKFTYGEYVSINDAYSGMVNESVKQSAVESIADAIAKKVGRKSLGKIRKCAKKSAKLATYATQTALNEACSSIDCDKGVLSEARKMAKEIIRRQIGENFHFDDFHGGYGTGGIGEIEDLSNYRAELDKIDSEVRDRYGDAPFKDDDRFENRYAPDEIGKEVDENEEGDEEDADDGRAEERDFVSVGDRLAAKNDDLSKYRAELDKIDSEVRDHYGDDVFDEIENGTDGEYVDDAPEDADADEDGDDAAKRVKYYITGIRMGMSDGKKSIGKPVSLDVDLSDQADLNSMEDVVDYVNDKVEFYFEPNDYFCDFSKVANGDYKYPRLCARKSLTSDSIQGSETLNKYFGRDGRFADYLYKADGTAKFEPSETDAEGLEDVEKDLNVVKKFPTLNVMVWMISTSLPENSVRDIEPDDFAGTEIRVIE